MDPAAYSEHSFFSVPLHYSHSLALDTRFSQEEKAAWRQAPLRRRRASSSDGSGVEGEDDEDEEFEKSSEDEVTPSLISSSTAYTRSKSLAGTIEGPADDAEGHLSKRPCRRQWHTHTSRIALLHSHNLLAPPLRHYTLRSKHIAILSVIMYKCLMSRDYRRAKRAFFLLLQEKQNQHKRIELRRMWEVGVEVLLQGTTGGEGEGLRKAVEYLNRLILRYPWNRKLVPTAEDSKFKQFCLEDEQKDASRQKNKKAKRILKPTVSAADFYPALIELLISHSEYCDAHVPSASAIETSPQLEETGGSEGNSRREYYRTPTAPSKLESPTHPLKIKQLIEEIMLTPPWVNDYRLWSLRAMINVWMADLEISGLDIEDEDDGDKDESEDLDDERAETPESMISEGDEAGKMRLGERRKLAQDIIGNGADAATRRKRRKHLLNEAKMCFKTAREKGSELPEDVLVGSKKYK